MPFMTQHHKSMPEVVRWVCLLPLQASFPIKKGPNPPTPPPAPPTPPSPPSPEPIDCDESTQCPAGSTCCCMREFFG